MKSIAEWYADLEAAEGEIGKLTDMIASEGRAPTEEEIAAVETAECRFNEAKAAIDILKRGDRARQVTEETGNSITTRQTPPPTPSTETRTTRPPVDMQWGFRSLGEQARAVFDVRTNPDRRLLETRAPTTWGSESVAADGGFAVAPDFRRDIMTEVLAETPLLDLCDTQIIGSNSMTFPKDEDTPWSSSGILAYWEGEGDALTESKPLLERSTLTLNKLAVLVPVTEELLEDVPTLDSYLRTKIAAKMSFKINDAIVNGTGVGMPLGLLNSGSKIEVAKETSQAATTYIAMNAVKQVMYMYASFRNTSVFLANQDCQSEIMSLSMPGKTGTGAASTYGTVMYMPARGMYNGTDTDLLMGRPLIYSQACQTLGTAGDVIHWDPKQYQIVRKAGVRSDMSMHLYFNYDLMCFRVIFRMSGQPKWRSTIAAKNGSGTYSSIVTIAVRS